VRRYTPDGSLTDVFALPTEQTTCCAFGGRGLRRVYVTTATEGWTDDRRRATHQAGLVYRLDVDATGRPAARFRPEPAWWATLASRPRVPPRSPPGRFKASTR
jgi:sugar lactone lactonase YvrE